MPGAWARLILLTVSRRSSCHSPPSVWSRFAAWLGFLAVLSALVTPVSLLAEEVRTGKLGGICSLRAVPGNGPDAGLDAAPHAGTHCELCGAPGWLLPPLAVCAIQSFAGQQLADDGFPADVAVRPTGLPYSRGPPAL